MDNALIEQLRDVVAAYDAGDNSALSRAQALAAGMVNGDSQKIATVTMGDWRVEDSRPEDVVSAPRGTLEISKNYGIVIDATPPEQQDPYGVSLEFDHGSVAIRVYMPEYDSPALNIHVDQRGAHVLSSDGKDAFLFFPDEQTVRAPTDWKPAEKAQAAIPYKS